MNQVGTIVKIEENKAVVVVSRSSACEKCAGCGIFSESVRKREFETEKPEGYEVGDRVILHIENSNFFLMTFAVYILPIIGLIAGYYIGSFLYEIIGISADMFNKENFSVTLSFVFASIFFMMIPLYEKKFGESKITICGKAEGNGCGT